MTVTRMDAARHGVLVLVLRHATSLSAAFSPVHTMPVGFENGTKSLRVCLPFTRCQHENGLKTVSNENGILVGTKRKRNPSCRRVNIPCR